jgi:hypothetical protein
MALPPPDRAGFLNRLPGGDGQETPPRRRIDPGDCSVNRENPSRTPGYLSKKQIPGE